MKELKVAKALLSLRLGVFVVMFVWSIDKLLNPDHSAQVFDHFYGVAGVSAAAFTVLGCLQLLLVFVFLAGAYQRFSYGLIFLLHGISTLSSWQQYLDAFNNLLFFAAWPMLAACFALYYLRDMDWLLAWDHRSAGVS